jgi:hypothetical protein
MPSLNQQWKTPNMVKLYEMQLIITRLYSSGWDSKLSCAFHDAKKNVTRTTKYLKRNTCSLTNVIAWLPRIEAKKSLGSFSCYVEESDDGTGTPGNKHRFRFS